MNNPKTIIFNFPFVNNIFVNFIVDQILEFFHSSNLHNLSYFDKNNIFTNDPTN